MDLLIQQQFLRDQGKTKKAEQIWFDKLEDELDRIEMDEALMKYREQHSRQKIAKDSEASLKDEDAHVNKQEVNPDSELGELDNMEDIEVAMDPETYEQEEHEADLAGRP